MPRPSDASYPGPRGIELDICEAIAQQRLLVFDYAGSTRVVQPYCHGFTRSGAESLRAIQVGGPGRPFGKLWTVAKMRNLRLTEEAFSPDDPNYNPNDSAMAHIHCRIRRS